VVLGLGSNLGDRETAIASAVRALSAERDLELVGVAPLYETAPFGGPPQSDYLNSAAVFRTGLSPREVLSVALAIERSLGRVRPDPVRWGPRTIDIDVLWIEGITVDEDGLLVPHPRLRERPFALRPLVDLCPDARDPLSGELYATLAAASAPIEKRSDRAG